MKSTTEEEPLTPTAVEAESEKKKSGDNAPVDGETTGDDKKKKIKKILIIAVPILLVVVGITLFFFFVIKAPKKEAEKEIPQSQKHDQVKLDSNTYLDIDPITVGLTQISDKKEYLRIDLTLRLNTQEENTAILAKMPIIKDTLITFLRSLRSTDFNSSSSSIYLKEEIAKRINKITSPIIIKEVLFQEITLN
ncbi:MAG: hypothetical protein EKK61_02255 [Rickettsiales bacterium]|nr:MAG: hypothetical protein EKK61_02255 [Rickettsiales bacterium]